MKIRVLHWWFFFFCQQIFTSFKPVRTSYHICLPLRGSLLRFYVSLDFNLCPSSHVLWPCLWQRFLYDTCSAGFGDQRGSRILGDTNPQIQTHRHTHQAPLRRQTRPWSWEALTRIGPKWFRSGERKLFLSQYTPVACHFKVERFFYK